MSDCCECCALPQRSKRRPDPSSRGVPPSVSHWMWSGASSILYTYSGQVEEVRLREKERKLSNFFSPIPRHVNSVHKLHLTIYVGNSTVTSFPQIFPTKFSRAFHYTYRASQTTRHSVKHCMICRPIYLQYIYDEDQLEHTYANGKVIVKWFLK